MSQDRLPSRESSATPPRVSVVVPCYNQGQYLFESVSSALASYEGPIEVVVVDDGSSERTTIEALREAERVSRDVVVVRQANRGLSAARNAGITSAGGDYIQLLDADDLVVAGKVDYQVAHLASAWNIDVSVTNFLLADDRLSQFEKAGEAIASFPLVLDDFLYSWERGLAIPIHCALFRRNVFDHTRFDESLRAKEDWVFWSTLVGRGHRIGYLHSHEVVYRQHQQSMRRSFVSMGESWMSAAQKIHARLPAVTPEFLDASRRWFEQYYRAQPGYQDELRGEGEPVDEPPASAPATVGPAELPAGWLARIVALGEEDDEIPLSVVIPVYNHFEYLPSCLDSVLDQEGVAFEVVCIDDASSDARVRPFLAAAAGCGARIRLIAHDRNRGISFSQNEAVALARGRFVAFLDCDDRLAAGALARMRDEILAHPEADYLFSDRLDIDEADRVIRTAVYGGYGWIQPSGDIRLDLLDGMVASHLKVIRRLTYIDVGGCDEAVSGVQDWDLALRIAEVGSFHYVPAPLYLHRVHSASVTRSSSVRQFRLTNVVRRRFAERWSARPGAADGVSVGLGLLDLREDDEARTHAAVVPSAVLTLDALKAAWRAGRACIVDARGEFNLPSVNLLREFNSYCDAVLCDQADTYAALLGYMWRREALVVAGRLGSRAGRQAGDAATA